jgi:hypothetical protein
MTNCEKYDDLLSGAEYVKPVRRRYWSAETGECCMIMAVSTSHPYGDRATEKNCTELYRKNPTHYSGARCHISEYYGEIFLHLYLGYALTQIV